MGYRVTAPLIQANRGDAGYIHVYEGGFLPDDIDPGQLEQLIAGEMVEEADPPTEGDDKPRRGRKADEG